MKMLLTDEARRRAKYISRILKLLEHFYFYILHFVHVRRMWYKDVMSYFASSSSYSNTFLVSAFIISQKYLSRDHMLMSTFAGIYYSLT